MYQVYIDKPSLFEPDMAGEFKNLEDAIRFAEKEKAEGEDITYTIEETNGTVNSYGEQITKVVRRG
ncbi:MAG: hypothetical protein MJ237_02070 [bacterium]|nr:hypothetical protein [bacterium]